VRLAVMDGKEAGHALCNAPLEEPCRNPPLDFKQARFCEDHSAYNRMCGIVGCNDAVVEGSKVCAPPVDGNVRHTFQATRTHCIQTLTWACGYPIAATKFYVSESESQCASWLHRLFPNDVAHLRPDYLAYDRACFLLRHLVTQNPNSPWVQDVRLIVDAWHYIGHRVSDILCRSRCNPAPADGSQPDLIIQEEINGRWVTRKAFNTEAAEQLNAWLDGYKGTLNRMTNYNFDFLLYCILFL
ncbi:hypothetical protein M407DRAFT_54802, partial [Tulasnella calospora MUT 4182]